MSIESFFPECEISFCEQRKDKWTNLRKGKLTASNMGAWLLKSDKTSQKAREGMICKLAAQTAGAWEPTNRPTEAMDRGTEFEPQAVASFESDLGLKVKDVGFCTSNFGHFGCSPDGLIEGQSAGLEGKVPIPATHIKYRRAGVLPVEYLYQVHGSMAVTGAKSWWFQCWNPALVPFRTLVERDEFTEQLFEALVNFSNQLDEAIEGEVNAWAKWKAKIKA